MDFIKGPEDFSASVEKALDEIDSQWRSYPGLVIAGTHTPTLFDTKISAIKRARETGLPFLGICWGLQLAAIEYARNCLDLKGANSLEIDPKTSEPVVIPVQEGLRVGIYKVVDRHESHWHQYQVDKKYLSDGWNLTTDEFGRIVEIARLKNHPFFVGTQFHPEYQSFKGNPHPILLEFITVCRTVAGLRR